MRLGRTKIAIFLLCFSLACTVPQLLADKKDQPPTPPLTTRGARCMRSIA